MSKYVYPAVFTKEGEQYSISFPDLEACFTQGEDLQDGMENAQDVLCLTLYNMEQNKEELPKVSDIMDIKTDDNSFVTLIACDTFEYEKFYKSKAVKKTLTIPEWLNEIAIRENVNFSNVLQNALIDQLHIN